MSHVDLKAIPASDIVQHIHRKPFNMINTALQLPCGKSIKNRLLKAAMSEQMADKNSNPTAAMATLYKRWANSGVGLILTGNIMLSKEARGEPSNVVLDEHSDLGAFRNWTDTVKHAVGTDKPPGQANFFISIGVGI